MLINSKVGAGALSMSFIAAGVLMVERRGITIVYQR